jgi:hypothetical protein
MRNLRILGLFILLVMTAGLAITSAGPSQAMPGWTRDAQPKMGVGERQRDEIRSLHIAYEAALSELDWSVGDDGHSAETLEQASELRRALNEAISDVMHRGGEIERTPGSACPYGGKAGTFEL